MEQEKTNQPPLHIIEVETKLDEYVLRMIRSWLCIYTHCKKGSPVQRATIERSFQKFLRGVTSTLEEIVDKPNKYHFMRLTKKAKYSYLNEYVLDKDIKYTRIKHTNKYPKTNE